MKFLRLILLLKYVTQCQSSFNIEIEIASVFQNRFASIYYFQGPLRPFLLHNEVKNDINNYLDSHYPQLNYNVGGLCNSSYFKDEKQSDKHLFCNDYFKYKHEKKFVFIINKFQLWFLSSENYTIHSDQILNNAGNIFFNTRLVQNFYK